jgi:hypothetical protein
MVGKNILILPKTTMLDLRYSLDITQMLHVEYVNDRTERTSMSDVITKRLSVRAIAIRYGLPIRTVSRAVVSGMLPAVVTTTDTGRERFYISIEDADKWLETLTTVKTLVSVGGDAQ